jgi:hypothetical protein
MANEKPAPVRTRASEVQLRHCEMAVAMVSRPTPVFN